MKLGCLLRGCLCSGLSATLPNLLPLSPPASFGSRNALLTPADRQAAPCIYRALGAAKQGVESGAVTSAEQIQQQVAAAIAGKSWQPEFTGLSWKTLLWAGGCSARGGLGLLLWRIQGSTCS